MRPSTLRSTSRGRLSVPVLIGGGALCLLTTAADGCNGYDNVSIYAPHLAATSPNADDSTVDAPVIVTRDNPQYYGSLTVENAVTGSASKTYSSDGKWGNLTGSVRVDVREPAGYQVHTDYGPLLPKVGSFQGPGQAEWVGRFGDLLHGNKYRASLSVMEGGNRVRSTRDLWLKLSDDVALVPVVVISWKKAGSDPSFQDQTKIAKALFDFIPYYTPDYAPAALSWSGINNPNKGESIVAPDGVEEPPDELYAGCNVQFQVLAEFVFELPPGHVPNWNTSLATFQSIDQIRARVRTAAGNIGNYLVDTLQPIYVAYGDMGSCAGPMGYTGKVVGSSPLAEINFGRTRVTTAHEIGHILMGAAHHTTNGLPTPGNLMRVNPSNNDKNLTPAQCAAAKQKAQLYSDRYRAFNHHFGRARNPVGPITTPDWEVSPTPLPIDVNGCCAVGGQYEVMSPIACSGANGTSVATSFCEVCCKQGTDATKVLKDQCAAGDQLSASSCDRVCCSAFSGKGSRYKCQQSGGQVVECPIEIN